MTAYYNEFDPKAAAWLRQLIANGDIATGYVDERSVLDVKAKDLAGYTQHHFFAGIGVWSYALRNAGWSDDRPVCTASLPCQPFSAAGNQKGKEDERHLLPYFLELVKECGFNVIIGEQVESAIRHGWLDDLQTTMEAENYTVGHCVLGAHSVNAAHQRQRLYWVAEQVCVGNSINTGLEGGLRGRTDPQRENIDGHAGRVRADSGEANSAGSGREQGVQPVSNSEPERTRCHSERGGMGDSEHDGHPSPEKPRGNEAPILSCAEGSNSTGELERASPPASLPSKPSGVGNSCSAACERDSRGVSGSEEKVRCEDGHFNGDMSFGLADASEIEWLYCRDEKYRPIKSGIKPLVDKLARGVVYRGGPIDANATALARTIRLKGYGNAIQADTATAFISAYMEAEILL